MDLSKRELLKDLVVLYVEDEDIILKSMEKILRLLVKEVYTAPNGKIGLEVFQQQQIDVVITDVKMPELNGIEMSKEIKKLKDVPIIITTAFVEAEFLIDAIEIGVNRYITKPAKADKLINAIADVIEPVLLRQEIEEKNKKLQELNAYLEQRIQEEIQKNKEKDLLLLKQSKLVSVDKLSISHLKELSFYAKDLSIIICEEQNLFEKHLSDLVKYYFTDMTYTTNIKEFMNMYQNKSYDIVMLSLDDEKVVSLIDKIKSHKTKQKLITLVYFKNYNYNSPLMYVDSGMCLIDKNDKDKLYYTLLLEAENISFDKRKNKYAQKSLERLSGANLVQDSVEAQSQDELLPSISYIEENIEEAEQIIATEVKKNHTIRIDPNDFDFEDIKNIKDDLENINGELMLNEVQDQHLDNIHLIFTRFYNTFYTFLAVDLKYQLKPFADAVKDIGDFVHTLNYHQLSGDQVTALSLIEHIIDDIINFINFVFMNKEITDIHYLEASLRDNLKLLKIELGIEKQEKSENTLFFF